MKEEVIQRTTLQMIKEEYPEIIISVSWNGELFDKDYRKWKHLQRNHFLKGLPDVTIHLPKGKTILMEFKTNRGRLTKEQEELKRRFEELGYNYYVVREPMKGLNIVEGEMNGINRTTEEDNKYN